MALPGALRRAAIPTAATDDLRCRAGVKRAAIRAAVDDLAEARLAAREGDAHAQPHGEPDRFLRAGLLWETGSQARFRSRSGRVFQTKFARAQAAVGRGLTAVNRAAVEARAFRFLHP